MVEGCCRLLPSAGGWLFMILFDRFVLAHVSCKAGAILVAVLERAEWRRRSMPSQRYAGRSWGLNLAVEGRLVTTRKTVY